MDPERNLISAAVRHFDLLPILDAGIKPGFFLDEEHQRVFIWMLEYWDRYGRCPTAKALKHEFPTYRLFRTQEPYQYYIDLLRQSRKKAVLHEVLDEAIERHKAADYEGTVAAMSDGILGLYEEVSSLTDDDLVATWESRMESYRSLRDSEGLRGIPTGFATLDKYLGGWQAEQLITLVGIPKAAKSWVMLASAMAAHDAGYHPLFVTFEMSNIEQAARHDAMLGEVNYENLLYGRMTKEEEKKVERALKKRVGMQPFTMIHDVSATTTVPALTAKLQQYRPDVIFVDGAYLMDSGVEDAAPTDTRALTAITRSLKRMAQRSKAPVVISTQASTYKYNAEKGMALKDILYSSGFSQDSDVIIAVDLEKGHDDIRVLTVVAGRNVKSGVKARLHFNWEQAMVKETEFDPENWGDDADDTYTP